MLTAVAHVCPRRPSGHADRRHQVLLILLLVPRVKAREAHHGPCPNTVLGEVGQSMQSCTINTYFFCGILVIPSHYNRRICLHCTKKICYLLRLLLVDHNGSILVLCCSLVVYIGFYTVYMASEQHNMQQIKKENQYVVQYVFRQELLLLKENILSVSVIYVLSYFLMHFHLVCQVVHWCLAEWTQ